MPVIVNRKLRPLGQVSNLGPPPPFLSNSGGSSGLDTVVNETEADLNVADYFYLSANTGPNELRFGMEDPIDRPSRWRARCALNTADAGGGFSVVILHPSSNVIAVVGPTGGAGAASPTWSYGAWTSWAAYDDAFFKACLFVIGANAAAVGAGSRFYATYLDVEFEVPNPVVQVI